MVESWQWVFVNDANSPDINTIFSEKYEEMTVALSTEREKLNTHSVHTEKSLTEVTNNFNEIHEEFKIFREKQQKKIEKLTIIFGITGIGLMSVVTYLLLT